jgi:hypothetical protein
VTNELSFRADLEDKVSGGLGKIGTAFEKVGGPGSAASLFGNIGAKAVSAGFGLIDAAAGKVVGVLGDAKQAFQDDQKSQALLDTSLRANVASYTGNKDAIEAVLLARERLGFSDDEQRASLATLLSRTHDVNKALEIQRTAMDLARFKGIDLGTATDLLGKAFSGQVGALKKAGIAVDAHATAEEALLAVQKAVAGQAETYANTDAGKEAAANQRVQESMEKIGEAVSKVSGVAIPIIADAFTGLVDVIGTVVGALSPLVDGIGAVVGAANDFIGSIPGPWHQASVAISQDALDTSAKMLELGKTPDAIAADLRESHKIAGAAQAGIGAPLVDTTKAAHDKVVAVARQTPGDVANAIRSARGDLKSAAQQLAEDLKHPISVAAERAHIEGQLAGANLAKGLRSKDPLVRAEARAYQLALMNRLRDLDTKQWGHNLGDAYAAGIRASYGNVTGASRGLGNILSRFVHVASPAKEGPLSEDGGIGAWGERAGALWAAGIAKTTPDLRSALGGALEPAAGLHAGAAGAGGQGGGVRILGVTEAEIVDMVDRGLYFKMQRAAPTLGRT